MTSSPMTCTGLRQPEILDLFEYNQDKLPSFHQAAIERIAKCIIASQTSATPVRSIKIVGHTDPVGSARYNLDLGKRRAEKTRVQIANVLNRLQPDLAQKFSFTVESQGETKPISSSAAKNRRVEIFVSEPKVEPLAELSSQEKAEFAKLSPENQARFTELRRTIEKYMGVARREADRGSRVLLQRGVYRARPNLLQVILDLTKITRLPSGWTLAAAKPLLIGNTLYNLSFPETINQGGTDRRGGKPDLTCFSASTQILLAHRFPVTYVRLIIQLATTSKATFAGGDGIGPLTFASTSLYKSLDSVLLQKAFDSYFNQVIGHSYTPGDELKVHRQVFGPNYPPKHATSGNPVAAFRKAFIANGGNTRLWEIINLYTRDKTNPDPKKRGNHSVVLTRIAGGRVYFYNPWANEEERNTMFGSAAVSVSGHGERPAESSMTQADFENQLTTVFHN